jgi:hypothetical protein
MEAGQRLLIQQKEKITVAAADEPLISRWWTRSTCWTARTCWFQVHRSSFLLNLQVTGNAVNDEIHCSLYKKLNGQRRVGGQMALVPKDAIVSTWTWSFCIGVTLMPVPLFTSFLFIYSGWEHFHRYVSHQRFNNRVMKGFTIIWRMKISGFQIPLLMKAHGWFHQISKIPPL